jgi:UDP-glucose 4-epimerase
MQTVWVTGALGFIGRYLARDLAQMGNSVLGLGHGPCPAERLASVGLTGWVNGDVDEANLRQLLQRSGAPDVIFHLAGGSSVGLSLQTPTEDFRRTVTSTAALLEWMRANATTTRLVVSSSAAVYGDTKAELIAETGCYTPYSPYGFHKRAAELLCESYAQNFGLQVAIVRLFSVYGPGLCKQLLWDLACRLQRSPDALELQGTGNEIRDWLYVEDAVQILVAASQASLATPLILNGGTGIGTCVRDVATGLCKALGRNPDLHFSGQQRVGDPFSLVADTTRLRALGVKPEILLHDGLAQYAEWFQQQQTS